MRPRAIQPVRERHGSARLRRGLTRYKQVSRGFSWGSRACRIRSALPLHLEPAALVRKGRAIGAQPLGVVERSGSLGETAESDKGPRPTEVCVGERWVRCEQRVVFGEDCPRIVTKQSQRREPDAIVGPARIGRKARFVGALCALEIAEPSANEAERVPGASVLRIAAHRLRETRLGELHLSPSCSPHPSGSWAGRIARSELRRSIVERQRLFVPVGELERMTELERWRGTSGTELLLERRRVALGAPEIAERSREPHGESPFELGLRLFREVLLEQLERFAVPPGVREQHRLAGALSRLRGTRPQGERKSQCPAGCPSRAGAFCTGQSAGSLPAGLMLAKTRPPALRKTMNAAEVRVIAVLGAGQMGAGIAQVAAAQGFRVTLSDVSVERATSGRDKILKSLDRLVEKGKIERSVRETVAQNIEPLTFDEAVGPADLVIEAAPENLALKLDLFGRAEARAKPDAVFASNTSSISITRLAAHTKRAERFFGMHFFNPVPLMKLVELVRGVATSPETMELGRALATRLDKLVIVSEDRPGFLVNRMLLPLLNEACFALQEGVGTAEDIDQGARLGLNHPMGPLELADFVGLDTVLAIADVLQREFGDDKYRPAMLLKNLVAAGFLGKKAGRGFYRYDAQGQRIVLGAGS